MKAEATVLSYVMSILLPTVQPTKGDERTDE
jgi:hypothetical protein